MTVEALLSGTSDIRLQGGRVVQTPLAVGDQPAGSKPLTTKIDALMPQVEIADVITEVDTDTNFGDTFIHLNSGQRMSPELLLHLYAVLLSRACNLGTAQTARATGLSAARLRWVDAWYLREDTLKAATTALVNAHHKLPLSKVWGGGMLSSSDGQRFPVKGDVKMSRPQPRYFGYGRGVTFYTWTSDQFSQYGAKSVPAPVRDATYVLDEILGNETELEILEHTTDTSGFTELVFALFDLLGLRFSPRIRDLKDQWLYRTGGLDLRKLPRLKGRFQGKVTAEALERQWEEVLRLIASLKTGHVTASLVVQKLQAYPRRHPLLRALQAYGRIPKTLHILKWYADDALRRRVTRQLNKGEAIHSLRSTLRYANQGKVKSQDDERLGFEVGCLNLLTNIVIYWNTLYMQKAVARLEAKGLVVSSEALAHVWPTRTEHINIYGKHEFKPGDIRRVQDRKLAGQEQS